MSEPLTLAAITDSASLTGDWGKLRRDPAPFGGPEFLETLATHGATGPDSGWQPLHWRATDAGGELVALIPSYLKSHSHGDFLRDWSWANAYQQLGKRYYPKLVSGWPYTPVCGTRLLTTPAGDVQEVAARLVPAIQEWIAENGISSWHFALPSADEAAYLQALGFIASHEVQFHWRNAGYREFADFLQCFSSEKRRKVKAERRKVAESGLHIAVRHGDEIAPEEWPALHRLYASTFDKYGNYAALSAACLAELATRLGRRMVVFTASEGSLPVAVSLCLRSDTRLFGRYWGTISSQHSLHFELCFYQGIEYCIREGLEFFEPGAGGEHKVARGFEPILVQSSHWIVDPRMRQLIGQHLARQQAAVAAYAEEAAAHLPFRASAPCDSSQWLNNSGGM